MPRWDDDLLDEMGLDHIRAEDVQKLDSVKYVSQLKEIGARVGDDVRMSDFAPFVPAAAG